MGAEGLAHSAPGLFLGRITGECRPGCVPAASAGPCAVHSCIFTRIYSLIVSVRNARR